MVQHQLYKILPKKLEKEEQSKPIVSRRITMKKRAEGNAIRKWTGTPLVVQW